MFLTRNQPVVIQCFTEDDYRLVSAVGAPFFPVRLGPADWVNSDLFRPPARATKSHDLVMVANWAQHKRHAQLFKALRTITDRTIRVLLIGFPWGGRTADDIRREAATYANPRVNLEIIENVPPAAVSSHVGRCKAYVFLSPKEGDNKALVEAMFADVPAIVYDKTIGGAGSRINAQTGIFASDEELPNKIRYMLDNYRRFSPRTWVLKHSGSANATKLLNDTLRRCVTGAGGTFTHDIVEKTNSPNLAYKDPSSRPCFEADYQFVLECGREEVVKRRDAVA
jgi:glycosyltransferase involved in cell wall biosynthesis